VSGPDEAHAHAKRPLPPRYQPVAAAKPAGLLAIDAVPRKHHSARRRVGRPRSEAVMGQVVAAQQPAVVLRSQTSCVRFSPLCWSPWPA
jgi:hypothetical protein